MKYELTENTKNHFGITLYQIRALKDFGGVKAGDLGGWVASKKNLSQKGDCWVSGNARVYDNARVSGNARVYGDAEVYGNARVSGNARVYGNAWVSGNARVYGNAWVSRGEYHSTHISITRSDGYTFTFQSDMSIVAGCRDFTPKEADAHWGNPEHHKHAESWAIVQALRSIYKARNA